MGTLAASSTLLIALPAKADFDVSPYVDIRQILSDSNNRDPRGSLELGAGFTARGDTKRLKGTVSYRYSRRFEEFGNTTKLDRHNANAAVSATIIDEFLVLDAGGRATQYATDARGFDTLNSDADNGNQTQVFSGYIEPRIRQQIGDFASIDANYRLSAVTADGPRENSSLSNNIGLDPTDGLGALLSDSVTHSGGVVVSSDRGTNTISWKLLADATLENIDQLNQKYRGYTAGAEFGVAITRKLQLTASGGYEDIENTQDSILFDPVTGLPVLDSDGNFRIDPAEPRRTAFDFSGEYWNVGFRYAPSRRTLVEMSGGKRYGDLNVLANITHTARNGMQVTGRFEQSLSSFSRLMGFYTLDGELIGASRATAADDFIGIRCGGGFDEKGVCIDPFIAAVSPATFKSDRGLLTVARTVESINWSFTAFYDKRRYVDSQQLQSPLTPPTTLFGADESFGLRGRVGFRLGENQSIAVDALAARSIFALTADRKDYRFMLGGNYAYQLNSRLSANASLYGSKRFSNTSSDNATLTATAGLRYRF